MLLLAATLALTMPAPSAATIAQLPRPDQVVLAGSSQPLPLANVLAPQVRGLRGREWLAGFGVVATSQWAGTAVVVSRSARGWQVTLDDGTSLAEALVGSGLAYAAEGAPAEILAAQRHARRMQRGLWHQDAWQAQRDGKLAPLELFFPTPPPTAGLAQRVAPAGLPGFDQRRQLFEAALSELAASRDLSAEAVDPARSGGRNPDGEAER